MRPWKKLLKNMISIYQLVLWSSTFLESLHVQLLRIMRFDYFQIQHFNYHHLNFVFVDRPHLKKEEIIGGMMRWRMLIHPAILNGWMQKIHFLYCTPGNINEKYVVLYDKFYHTYINFQWIHWKT